MAGPQLEPRMENPTFETSPVVALVGVSVHGRPLITGTLHRRLLPLTCAAVMVAVAPSAAVDPVRVIEHDTGWPNEAGEVTTIDPGAVNAVLAGEIVAAPATPAPSVAPTTATAAAAVPTAVANVRERAEVLNVIFGVLHVREELASGGRWSGARTDVRATK
ncbi:hypothetical protein GCM10007298_30550 [Williamsia phyllosphaerae]|uniref:Uncharacterized protein n=1 Tax=Williamsia phyllosphaerae TaxID=885042 RepID=A0ABQ1V1X9_9NOCA|nr:hypothetical protein GCM10007298_30550 [Williamsia phyllosphaerae]